MFWPSSLSLFSSAQCRFLFHFVWDNLYMLYFFLTCYSEIIVDTKADSVDTKVDTKKDSQIP